MTSVCRRAIIANSLACICLAIVLSLLITHGRDALSDIVYLASGSVLATCIGLSVSNIMDMSYRHKRDK